jgi:hypothetical protein
MLPEGSMVPDSSFSIETACKNTPAWDIATFDDGSIVVVWSDASADSFFLQRFDSAGNPLGNRQTVTSPAVENLGITSNRAAGTYEVFVEGKIDMNCQLLRFSSSDTVGEKLLSACHTSSGYTTPHVTPFAKDELGNSIAVWGYSTTTTGSLRVLVFDSKGQSWEQDINPGANPSITAMGGRIALAWNSVNGVQAGFQDPQSPISAPWLLASVGDYPSVAGTPTGDLVVLWREWDCPDVGVLGRIVHVSDKTMSSVFRIHEGESLGTPGAVVLGSHLLATWTVARYGGTLVGQWLSL